MEHYLVAFLIMSNLVIPKEVVDKITNSFLPASTGKTKPYRIKINGQFIAMTSKKTMWRNIGFARSALLNHVSGNGGVKDIIIKHFGTDFYYKKGFKVILVELERLKVIEFVEI